MLELLKHAPQRLADENWSEMLTSMVELHVYLLNSEYLVVICMAILWLDALSSVSEKEFHWWCAVAYTLWIWDFIWKYARANLFVLLSPSWLLGANFTLNLHLSAIVTCEAGTFRGHKSANEAVHHCVVKKFVAMLLRVAIFAPDWKVVTCHCHTPQRHRWLWILAFF